MKAMLINEQKDFVWSEVADPVIGEEEVLVQVWAAGVNRADLLQREGKYPSPPGCPEWMGLEVSGKIVQVGAAVTGWKVGDMVCALLGGGGYAEYVAVKYDMLMPIPKGLTAEEAAGLPEVFATAYLNLFLEGHLEAGQTVFIPAGGSGLASAAIPLAKAFGARVITSVRRQEQVEKVAKLGADLIINTTEEAVEAVLAAEEAAGRPVHVSMDCLCGETLGKSFPYMAKGGYWIVISTLAGTQTTVQLRPLLSKGLHLVGSTLRSRAPAVKAQILSELVSRVWPRIEDGTIRPTVYRMLSMAQVEQAHGLLAQGAHVGKVILQLPHA